MRLLLRIIANCLAILLADKYLPGFIFTGSTIDLFMAGIIIGLINALIKPIITLISLPIIFLTLGLFNLVINIFILFLADKFLETLVIQNITTAILAIIIFSITNYIISHLGKVSDLKK